MKLWQIMSAGASLFVSALPVRAAPVLPAPKLIVAISVDQLSADLFAEYRPLFTAGLKRLAGGVVFPAGYQAHAATETCPGHATILTGAHPARSGIIANDWFDLGLQREEKKVYCAEDPAASAGGAGYIVSPAMLRVPTLGDRMKVADPAARVVSVAGKDRAAVMLGGHATDAIWYWGGKAFVTLPGRTAPPPDAVVATNAAVARAVARPGRTVLPAICRDRARPVAVTPGRSVGVPIDRKAEDFGAFRTAAAFDAATADLAIGLMRDMRLGRGRGTDLLAIGLSATDYVGHRFGTAGGEMCAQMVALDGIIGRIMTALDRQGVPYALVLTADHGGHDLPERNRQRGFADAQRVDPALAPGTFGRDLAARLGISADPLILGDAPFGDWYLSRSLSPADRARVLRAAVDRLTAHPQVETVFAADALRDRPLPRGPMDEWSLADRLRAGFHPGRSGDLIVLLKPHVTPISDPGKGYVATHGSPWNYDRRVPILFYRPGATGFEQPLPVATVDILPTLAALIGLAVPPQEIDGRCLDLDSGPADSCGR